MKKVVVNTKRNTNIEILRIIAILLIVISHYSVHNVTNVKELSFGINKILLQMMTLGNIGSELFMLITGYYLINSSKVKLSKLLKLWLQIIFYSVGVYILFVLLNLEPFSYTTFIKSFFPITFEEYWFASVYFIIYLFHPYINVMINNLNKNKSVKLFIISLLILILSTIGLEYLNNNIGIRFIDYLYSRNSLIVVMISVSLFNIFKSNKEFSNKIINNVSSCVFGVYLLSETPVMRSYLWKNIFNNYNCVSSYYLIIHMLISVLLTFIVCLIVEEIRKLTLELFYNKFISKRVDNISEKLNNFYLKLVNNFVK